MTTPRDDRMYETVGKTRRSPPGGDSQSSGFFQTGQGGRTVLPPLSSAFPTSSRSPVPNNYPNPYLQSRASPPKAEFAPQWATPTSVTAAQQQQHSSAIYEHYDSRYQQPYATYVTRTTPIPADPHGSRKLPPLTTPSTAIRDDRWQGSGYGSSGSQMTYGDIRSPTATYPAEYAPYQHHTSSYSYPPVPDPRGHPSQLPSIPHLHQMSMGIYPAERGLPAQVEVHGSSPYIRGTVTNSVLTQEPVSMLPSEEPAIKKKRKRADAAQLKVLNEVYTRTAFPSTEERAELAKKLDMSARSVQIWFQNKRQSMRQTSRQASNTVKATSHQPFSMPPQVDDANHATYSSSISPTTVPAPSYFSPPDSRPPGGQDSRSPLPSRREADTRKWSSGRY